jgi:hypothetical protein
MLMRGLCSISIPSKCLADLPQLTGHVECQCMIGLWSIGMMVSGAGGRQPNALWGLLVCKRWGGRPFTAFKCPGGVVRT